MTTDCPRCNTALQPREEPWCYQCGFRDFGPTPEAHVYVKNHAIHQPRVHEIYHWTYTTFFAKPVEQVGIAITYRMQTANPKSMRAVAVVDDVTGWPWHRWQPPEGEAEVKQAFQAAIGLDLWALTDCLKASGTAGWAERMRERP